MPDTTKFHPSTSTKSKSLKGKEIMTGGIIIMPKDNKIDATIMSINIKGM